MSEKKTVGGIPVECLTGESAAIWSGWRTLGDRELVREASAKGTHIKLAHKCLAYRRNCTVEQACTYFNKEVETWVNELLNKKQVYRASHILKNMGKDPIEHIFAISIKSKDPPLRNYLCEYMINANGFKTEHVAAWNIIKSINEHEEKRKIQDGLSSCMCIDDIIKLPQNIEQALRTELYFSLDNPEVLGNVSNNILWNYLLSNNKINALRMWIDAKYNPDIPKISDEIDEHLKSLFINLDITPDMIDYIDSSKASDLSKNLTKNYLCRYGIYTKEEKSDLKLILNRSFGCGITLDELNAILSLPSCNINKTEFLQSIDQQLCLRHCSENWHTQEDDTKLKTLFNALTYMCNAQDNYEDALLRGLLESIDYISNDFNDYLKTDYSVSLSLIFLRLWQMQSSLRNEPHSSERNTLMRDIFTSKSALTIDTRVISEEVLQLTLEHMPGLQCIIKDQNEKDDMTVYDLVDGYRNLNSKLLFKWRFKNEPMPTFTNENLIKQYGYQETLMYGYYLKEGRPNMAVHNLIHAQAKFLGNVSSHRKFKAALYAHVLALRNLDKTDIVCSCIAFIELLRIDSSNLQLHVTVAKYVQEQLNISIGNLLENVVYKSQTDVRSVITYLEQSFQKHFLSDTFMCDNTKFIEALKMWDVIVRFARVHNYALPDMLPKYLADNDLWFEFIAVCHIFSYPITQMMENAKLFNNANIREHLLTCLTNDKLSEAQPNLNNKQKMKFHDTRQPRHKDEVKENGSPVSTSAISEIETDTTNVTSTNGIFNKCISSDKNLWFTILNCHQSQDPPKAFINASRLNLSPILTVLATCYEPSSAESYCYCWMVISTGKEDILLDYAECLEQHSWPSDKILKLLNKMIQYGYINTINRALKIFTPKSVLISLFEFLTQAISYGEFKENQQHLIEFKSNFSRCNEHKDFVDEDSVDFACLNNLYWVADLATQCIVTALGYGFQSTFLRVKFLEVLINCNFSENLPVAVPNFQRLLDLTKILQETDVTLNFKNITLINKVYYFDMEIKKCIDDLIAIENYNTALELACCVGFNSSEIILAQSRNIFKQSINKDGQVSSTFWTQCAKDFNKYHVSPQVAIEFFVEHAEKVISNKERYEVLKLAYETLKRTEIEQQITNTLEMAMWKTCILIGPENIELDYDHQIFNKLKTELLAGLDELQVSCNLIEEKEKHAAEILINKLINLGRLDVALRISIIFKSNHKDLQILMLCLSLAEGEISPADLTPQQKSLLEDRNQNKQKYSALRNRGLQRFSSSSSLNTTSSIVESNRPNDTVNTHQTECISILEKLSEALTHGNEICFRIISCYKLSMRLGKAYQSLLILQDPIKFLQEIIESNIENKFETANDIIMSYKIKTEDVATFLADNIAMHITFATENGQDDLIFMWGYSLNSHFHLIMELCSDISLLGLKLLKTAQSLLGRYVSTHDEKKNVSGLKTIVELLIRSHDCFTASCNMEGIASVLRKCQNLANMLQLLKHWALLVRLVTGVGRFTEMNYIFQILKENDQFESLLGQGLDKVPGLKMALLEFLKRQCPEDKELFTLVALHFRLYYEIALMWENEAKEVIAKLISDVLKEYGRGVIGGIPVEIKLTRNDNVQTKLQLAVTNLTHATQYYLQDKKLNLARRCSHQAQLVALQISLVNAVSQNQQAVCLLNLKSDELERILSHVLNFPQALIVIRAYNYHADWVNLIYHHCILKGETKYLKEFMTVNNLTPTIVQDCARRYRFEISINHSMTDNMRTLISELSDVECKYMLASQLGFKDIVEELLNDPIVGSYLKDTIWKKGYIAS